MIIYIVLKRKLGERNFQVSVHCKCKRPLILTVLLTNSSSQVWGVISKQKYETMLGAIPGHSKRSVILSLIKSTVHRSRGSEFCFGARCCILGCQFFDQIHSLFFPHRPCILPPSCEVSASHLPLSSSTGPRMSSPISFLNDEKEEHNPLKKQQLWNI